MKAPSPLGLVLLLAVLCAAVAARRLPRRRLPRSASGQDDALVHEKAERARRAHRVQPRTSARCQAPTRRAYFKTTRSGRAARSSFAPRTCSSSPLHGRPLDGLSAARLATARRSAPAAASASAAPRLRLRRLPRPRHRRRPTTSAAAASAAASSTG